MLLNSNFWVIFVPSEPSERVRPASAFLYRPGSGKCGRCGKITALSAEMTYNLFYNIF